MSLQAPEVIRKSYGCECDVWSAGVILYVMLSGRLPFWGETIQHTYDEILFEEPNFTEYPWPEISTSAKDLLRKLLCKTPSRRYTVLEALSHSWLRRDGDAPQEKLNARVQDQLKQFTLTNKVQRMARLMISRKMLSSRTMDPSLMELRHMFESMDLDGSHLISHTEFKHALKQVSDGVISEDDADDVIKSMDTRHHGRSIDYETFLAAAIGYNQQSKTANIDAYAEDVFKELDRDSDGLLSQEDLESCCTDFNDLSVTGIADVLKFSTAKNGTGKMTHEEFLELMQSPKTTTHAQTGLRRNPKSFSDVMKQFFGKFRPAQRSSSKSNNSLRSRSSSAGSR
ncbi:Mitogen-activated protein kinase cpk1 [Cymbomonas tetramitiformis]|uniref:Mitogen-activated protein kinase cpk1 n=1 Tax=Cymbomonas tetramitiformis TaxID=36881 RepID=A0AAE0EXM9_9CHLO|nr:Mitogen-activated protein kinase cpk1 [Cymbomonas tetramitiformis]|eukprot:gene4757-5817_t